MNKNKFLSSVLILWILGWIYIGIEQVQISIDYKFSQYAQESIYEPGYKIIKKNGTKFLIKDAEYVVENINLNESKYFIFSDKVSNSLYSIHESNIKILFKDGNIKDLSYSSDQFNLKVLAKTINKYFLCSPSEYLVE